MPADPHKPLHDDVRLLGQLLGETLRTHVGQDIFETVETVRAMAKSAREGDETDFARLKQTLGALPVAHALLVARAFAHFLHLANIAEQHHRVRRRRWHAIAHTLAYRDRVDPLNLVQVELLRQLRHAGHDAQLHDALLVTINGMAAGMRNTG
jgi:phosphoenolpyruvate carboxylase